MNPFTTGVLENKRGLLYIGKVSAVELAERFGTPLYVTDEGRLRDNLRRFSAAFKKGYEKCRVYYAAKANSNISILKIFLDEGAYLDAASPGEIFLGLRAGYPPHKIMFTGTSVSREELEYALKETVVINIDSLSQLDALLQLATPETLSVRINPEIGSGHHEHVITGGKDSKFGLWKEQALEAFKTAKEAGVKSLGAHMHIGSGILKIAPYLSAVENFMEIVGGIAERASIRFEFIDIGGGFGVPYKLEEEELDIQGAAQKITSTFRRALKRRGLGEPALCLEPGRYLVCDSTVLLTKVQRVKKTPHKSFIGVDAGFNTLIRPAMYGSYHHIVVANRLSEKADEKYDIVGPLCESGDFLGKGRVLPKVSEGDVLAVLCAGAYGYSMSSQYNARPRPAEILVKDGRYEVIRERETLSDLADGQKVASWLS
ncbi:MAG: diaminopimelate decarboxylase [Candidatus Bathyarchaeia archaeon]